MSYLANADHLYDQGKELFLKGEYTKATYMLREVEELAGNNNYRNSSHYIEEAATAMARGKGEVVDASPLKPCQGTGEAATLSIGGAVVSFSSHVVCVTTERDSDGPNAAMAELQEGISDVCGMKLRCMMDQQLASHKDFHPSQEGCPGIVPILVGYSRVLLERFDLADKLCATMEIQRARYHIFCEGPSGVFILGHTDEDLMEAVHCFLSELAKQAMGGGVIKIAELNKFGF